MIEATTLNPKTGNSRVWDLVEKMGRFRPGVLGNRLLRFVRLFAVGKRMFDVESRWLVAEFWG